jgi:tRNA-dihydrouridine synthase B
MLIGNHLIDPPYILAPLAGYTDLPFRLLARRLGCGLAYTEMISAEGLGRQAPGTWELLEKDPADHPLTVQLFGSRPESLARAAAFLEEWGADIIDLNLGCPVKKVVKTGAGSALLKDPSRAQAIFKAVRQATTLPLTVKLRSGWRPEEPTGLTVAQMAEDCGFAAVVLHPRWAVQGFTGQADWALVGEYKRRLTIPVIGNGDILDAYQALTLRKESGCDGVMIGRQALRAPWIFGQIEALEAGRAVIEPDLETRKGLIEDYWRWILEHYQGTAQIKALRRALFVLTRGLPGSGQFRQQVGIARSLDILLELFEQYFAGTEDREDLVETPPDPLPPDPLQAGQALAGSRQREVRERNHTP